LDRLVEWEVRIVTEEKDGTRVDLGDDLVEKTAMIPGLAKFESPPIPSEKIKPPDPDDQVESAKILIAEGMQDEAKKILHQILMTGVNHGPTRKLLEELHELELKQIFSGQEIRPRGPLAKRGLKLPEIDPDKVLRKLDDDLKLGVFGASGLSLFSDSPEELAKLSKRLDREMISASTQDRIDLGIGFVEMGLFDIAARQFRAVMLSGTDATLEGACLYAYCMICAERPYDAISGLQGVLNDGEIRHDEKLEVFYLMGRSYELLKNHPQALSWYGQAGAAQAGYRDIAERIQNLTPKKKTQPRKSARPND
jgi:hypothetical protein